MKDAHCISVNLIHLPGLPLLLGGIDVPDVPDVPKSQVVFCVVEVDPDAYSVMHEYIGAMLTPVIDYTC